MERYKAYLISLLALTTAGLAYNLQAVEGEAIRSLQAPVTVKGTAIERDGEEVKGEITFKNQSGKTIKEMLARKLYYGKDGQLIKTVPYTVLAFSGTEDLKRLKPEEEFTKEITGFFLDENMVRVDGLIANIIYEDGSQWPPLPTEPIKQDPESESGIGLKYIGQLEADKVSRPVVACQNHNDQAIGHVTYRITYYNESGEELLTVGHSWGGSQKEPLLKPGETKTLNGGDGPPKGAVKAHAYPVTVDFFNGGQWWIDKYADDFPELIKE